MLSRTSQPPRATPYRIGIFPGAGEFPSSGSLLHEQSEEQVARSVQASIENNRASVLAYSYYDDVLNEPRIKKPGKLWVRKKPNLDLVVRLARERRLDGVVMYSGILAFSTWYTKQPNPIWVYVIDIERGQVYREKGKNKDSSLTKLADKMLTAFVEGRGEKLDVASISAEETPAQVEEKTRATPYRIGVFPFGAFSPYGDSYIEPAEEQTADTLQTVVDDHPMFVRTYSFYDDVLNAPRLRKPEKLWVGTLTKKKPAVSLVSTAGRERNVDGVLMGWLRLPAKFGWYGGDYKSTPVDVYLIDVDSRKVYRAQGTNTTKVVDKVLAAFVEGRGETLDIASISAEETPTKVEEKTRSTPYRIGVFPFEIIDAYGSGFQLEEVRESTVDALQTFVDNHPSLALTYSYFDRMLNAPRLRKVNKLWAGGRLEKKPVVSLVSTAARERNVDGVLMCWLLIDPKYAAGAHTRVPVEVYLIDVDSDKVYRAKGNLKKADVLLDKVVSQFLDDHPKVVP